VGSTPTSDYVVYKRLKEKTMNALDNDVKCMCGHNVDEKDVVYINPATKAITWTEGLPYCGSCVPTPQEEL
jgi:hypothetical protein